MVQVVNCEDEIIRVSQRSELPEMERNCARSSSLMEDAHDDDDDESALHAETECTNQKVKKRNVRQYSEMERLALSDDDDDDRNEAGGRGTQGALERRMFVEKFSKHNHETDNLRLLRKVKKRIDRVGVKLPTIEVRYKNLCVEAECTVVHGKPLPTLWNSIQTTLLETLKFCGSKPAQAKITILDDISGIIKPGRMTLLLGPSGCGKSSLLKSLSGNLHQCLKVTGEVSYNGYNLDEFVPQKTSAYVSQYDLHIPEITVRETLAFSARCQGVGSQAEIMSEVLERETEAGIVPDPETDAYMKTAFAKGQKGTFQTDYILKILGLQICADTIVGSAMKRGISGGQKRRLTTGEMIIGPIKALFMDEITNGLDSSSSFQVISCLQQLVHINEATVLVSLLQPAPETFDLFDDIILMAEGKIVYHGPRDCILEYFEQCGFRCPERKGVAEFLLEVVSKKNQAKYWSNSELAYSYVSVDMFSLMFKESSFSKKLDEKLSEPFDKSKDSRNALSFSVYSGSKWELFKACWSRELLLMKRNASLYVFKTSQFAAIALITVTVFLRTQMEIDVLHANYYMGALFFALHMFLVEGIPEVSMTVARLPAFYKQKEYCFYPAWAYAIPAVVTKLPLSFVLSLAWTSLTYYIIGYSSEVWRFFYQFVLLFTLHVTSLSMFRLLASVIRTLGTSIAMANLAFLLNWLFAGFIIAKPSMPDWLKWGFWVTPVAYGEIGLSVNEFLAPRWQKKLFLNATIGEEILQSRGLNYDGFFTWISLSALLGFIVVFNIGFTLALSFLKSPGSSDAMISYKKVALIQESEGEPASDGHARETSYPTNTDIESNQGRTILPFQPLTITFQDLKYYVDTPVEMRKRGFAEKRLQLLSGVTGAFRPGVLTALMGVSGAGKTTLFDVLAGRKTSGYIEGEIKIDGYLKVQKTFARVSGYCEQTDIHSPQMTVKESLIFSAWLRLAPQIDSKTKMEFVNEVLEIIELDEIKDALVGMPGVNGLSVEQRKRLTIAVELVSNPCVIFIDEPTTGLDARAAAIVMQIVKSVVETRRTVVCTIHQPSIDIFEMFDELILLKTGGKIIYSGPLGQLSSRVIEYFEGISGVPKIEKNYNPAAWMLEVTSATAESELGVDFAQLYRDSTLCKCNMDMVLQLSTPLPGSKELHFPTAYSQNGWEQFKCCLWKQHLSYWRSPTYNLTRIMITLLQSLIFGVMFWNQGQKIHSQQNLFNIAGCIFAAVNFNGVNNCSAVVPYIATERTVMYRERFAGMYSLFAYPLSQVAIEVPYLLSQAVIFVIITYPMIGFHVSAIKVSWYFYYIFCSLLYFTYLGMLLMSLTPNYVLASILCSASYKIFGLFSGFLIPQPQIPKWWIWSYYLTPSSWTLNGLLTSQYGDLDKEITVFGVTKPISVFLKDYYGFRHDHLPMTAAVLMVFPIVLAFLFVFFVGRLNFQHR